jgi:hypothetical protein
MIGKGMKGTADWSGANGLFADFVRSLLITEYALPDPDNGVPTGWNDLDVARWSAARGVRGGLKLGDNGAVASPAMSYSLRIANVPLRAGETATPLIVRRQKPDATELFIVLKPATGTTIGTSRAKNAVSQGPGGVALPASWMTQPTSLVPVGMANITTGAGNASPLYVYRLQPPKEITSTPAGGGVTLRWKKPDLGEKLRAEDALHGYRVFYENKDGKTVMVPDFLIKPETEAVTILASAMPGFTTVGLASEDQFVRDANGKPLLSPIAWPETQSGVVTVIVHEPKPDNVDMSYGFENVLGGKPIPKAPVTCDYVDKGKPVHLEAETDAKGVCRFSNIPFNVEITISAQGMKKKALCTADKTRPSVTFGWMGHEIKPEDMPRVEGERTQSKPSN